MELSKAIQQKEFKSEHEKALINLLFTSGYISYQQMQFFKSFALSPQQYNVLRILKGQYPKSITVRDVQERMLDKMSNASRLVDKLEVRKLVSRNMCGKDRRRMDVCITQSGLQLLEEMEYKHAENIRQLCHVDEYEAKTLNKLLDKLRGEPIKNT